MQSPCRATAALILSLAGALALGLPYAMAGDAAQAGAKERLDRSRVVSIGGSVTEILYALGLDGHIVAVDTTSVFPPAALAEHPNVGYMRALSAEGVLSMSPTLILAEADAGPKEALAVLAKASVPLVSLPADPTPAGLAEKIRVVGRAMDAAKAAGELADAVAHDLDEIKSATGKIDRRVSALFILTTSGGRIVAAGDDTTAAAMIEMAGGRNAFAGVPGYKPASPEAIVQGAPDVIVTMNRKGHEAVLEQLMLHPALAETPAVKNRRIVVMDGLYLLGFGPRTAHATRDLAHALYPEIALPELRSRPWIGDRPPVKTSGQ